MKITGYERQNPQDTEKRHADDYQDTSIIPDSVSHGSCMSVDELREWLRSLPEPSYQEMQDYLWHERDR